jgi:hypothetical protein
MESLHELILGFGEPLHPGIHLDLQVNVWDELQRGSMGGKKEPNVQSRPGVKEIRLY